MNEAIRDVLLNVSHEEHATKLRRFQLGALDSFEGDGRMNITNKLQLEMNMRICKSGATEAKKNFLRSIKNRTEQQLVEYLETNQMKS
ncbi:CLUMA_CG005053, isoform A [Clunio marinus]|uniref:CLUMA_CG005053, isoform A n=1 Tax=Clunio marinus TaxID=568069 RepID=A0A1J1HVJ7_9DIPT|nr:CLUMA_CG005053, isoform A [Clunio marinus]